MSDNDTIRMIFIVMSIALLATGGWFAFFKQNISKSIQMALIWAMIFIGLTLAYGLFKG